MEPESAAPGLAPLVDLYAGAEARQWYDEDVTELAHGLQAAALAAAAGSAPSLIAAALLHDVGHLVVHDLAPIDVDLERDFHHERAGATTLGRWFGPAVTDPVRLHVAAKRYLCAVESTYFDQLSLSSVRSLQVQGGPMTADEIAWFQAEPGHHEAVLLRRWDDEAKVADADVADFASYLPLLETLVVAPSP